MTSSNNFQMSLPKGIAGSVGEKAITRIIEGGDLKIWWAVVVSAVCFTALLFAPFGSDWLSGTCFATDD